MGGKNITAGTATEIKKRIWEGESQVSISRLLYTSQATVSRICSGQLYADIAWPDGSLGAIDMDKKREMRVKAKAVDLRRAYDRASIPDFSGFPDPAPPPNWQTPLVSTQETPIQEDMELRARIKRIIGGQYATDEEGHIEVIRQESWQQRISDAFEDAERRHQEEFMTTGTSPEYTEQAPVPEEESSEEKTVYEAYSWERCILMAAGRCKFINSMEELFPSPEDLAMARQAAATVYKAIELTVDNKGGISWNQPVVSRLIVDTLEDMRSRPYEILIKEEG